jgi:hypothetical protein
MGHQFVGLKQASRGLEASELNLGHRIGSGRQRLLPFSTRVPGSLPLQQIEEGS